MKKTDKLIKQVEAHLESKETVRAVVKGTFRIGLGRIRKGIFLATDEKLYFFARQLLGFHIGSVPYKEMSSIELTKGLLGYKIRFASTGKKGVMKYIKEYREKDVNGFVEHVKNNMSKESEQKTNQQDDIPTQIKKLSELKEQNILSEEEFTLKKQELLKNYR